MIRWVRRKLGRRREVELLEVWELCWRLFILISVACVAATPWLLLWRWLT